MRQAGSFPSVIPRSYWSVYERTAAGWVPRVLRAPNSILQHGRIRAASQLYGLSLAEQWKYVEIGGSNKPINVDTDIGCRWPYPPRQLAAQTIAGGHITLSALFLADDIRADPPPPGLTRALREAALLSLAVGGLALYRVLFPGELTFASESADIQLVIDIDV